MASMVATSDNWQGCLFGTGEPAADATFAGLRRTQLDATSWVDLAPGWVSGADQLFADLRAAMHWRQREVVMFHRRLPEPRLTAWWNVEDATAEPHPVLGDIRRLLTERYGCSFVSIGCNYYRHGQDSVAWHGDRHRRDLADPTVAIVSVGAPRPLYLRPKPSTPGGPRRRRAGVLDDAAPSRVAFHPGHGDLLVMGGACQHDWEHMVPKVAQAEPRISIVYREA